MFKLFIALNILIFNLYACKGGFDSCKKKIIDSKAIYNQQLQIPVEKHKRLIFSKTPPKNAKILKHDKFLHLYLVEDKKGFKYPFRINNKLTLGTAAVDKKMVLEGKITKHQVGLNKLAKYNEALFVPSILLNSCCALEGIVTPKGIIEKEYIERFLKVKKVEYADIGIRIKDDGCVKVIASSPFLEGNPFKMNDCILSFDKKKVYNASELMRWILFAKVGSTHKVKVKRDGKIITLSVKSTKRKGGGFISDTFLEFLGLTFNKSLHVVKIAPKAKKYQLLKGDKLLQINGVEIKSQQDILNELAKSQKESYLLFERRNFQFFIHIKR
jgi:hypothetical protein